jgi:hypothetical protein
VNKWIAIALLVAGCKQGLGDHCQTNSDCTDGICSMTKHICVTIGTNSEDEIDGPSQPLGITSFKFLANVNATLAADVIACPSSLPGGGAVACGTSITATVPAATDRTALIATFDINGAYVTVGGATQLSGNGPNHTFTGPVVYTVTGMDGSTQDVTVTVVAQ